MHLYLVLVIINLLWQCEPPLKTNCLQREYSKSKHCVKTRVNPFFVFQMNLCLKGKALTPRESGCSTLNDLSGCTVYNVVPE